MSQPLEEYSTGEVIDGTALGIVTLYMRGLIPVGEMQRLLKRLVQLKKRGGEEQCNLEPRSGT